MSSFGYQGYPLYDRLCRCREGLYILSMRMVMPLHERPKKHAWGIIARMIEVGQPAMSSYMEPRAYDTDTNIQG